MSFFKNIVVADQRGKLDRFVCQVLGQDRWQVSLSDNFSDLEENIRSQRQHLVILSADMPGLNIKKFMHKLNEMFGMDRPRVLLCVYSNVSRTLREGVKAGVDDYLTVPFHGTELQTKVLKLLQFFNARDEMRAEIKRLHEILSQEQSSMVKLEKVVAQEKKEKESLRKRLLMQKQKLAKGEAGSVPKDKKGGKILKLKRARRSEMEAPKPDLPPIPQTPDLPKPNFTQPEPTHVPEPPVQIPRPPTQNRLQPINSELTGLIREPNLETNQQAGSKTLSLRAVTVAIKLRGLEKLVQEIDAKTTQHVTQYLFNVVTKTMQDHHGHVLQIQKDTIVCYFHRSPQCVDPGHWAAKASISLQEQAIFLSEIEALLAPIEFSIAIHSGELQTVSFGEHAASGQFVFGHTVEECTEIVEVCPRSEILVTEDVYNEHKGLISVHNEMILDLLSSAEQIRIARLSSCKLDFAGSKLEDNSQTQVETPEPPRLVRRAAKLA